MEGLTFHRSFAINKPAIAAILANAGASIDELREATHLGTVYLESMPRYARACGLLEFGSTQLTPLGEHVLAHDPSLSLAPTQWLMHYHLCAPHGPGPRFWHDLILRLPHLPQPFRKGDVVAEIDRSVREESGAALKDRGIESTATVFLGSYTKTDALGPLEIMEEAGSEYGFRWPEPPPAGVFAYALSHYWQGQLGAQQTCTLDDLGEPGGLGSLFLMGSFDVNRALRQLARQGLLELWMAAPPYQVTRPPAPEKLLEGIYAAE